MDIHDLIAQLRAGISYQREQDIVHALERLLHEGDAPIEQRRAHALGEAIAQSAAIMSHSWRGRLDRAAAAYLEQISERKFSLPSIIAGMVGNGIAQSAVELAPGPALWVPTWLLRIAEARSGYAPREIALRWAISPQWPIPVEQALVDGFVEKDDIAGHVVGCAALATSLSLPSPEFPQHWLAAPKVELPSRDDLVALLAMDGPAGMAALLSSPGSPLSGFAREIAASAQRMDSAATLSGHQWTGTFFAGRQMCLFEDTIVVLPGWMSAALMSLGLSCAGVPDHASEAVEAELVGHCGGVVVDGEGGKLHIFPRHEGAIVRALDIDWSAVPRI
jgi:hypothetical protein